MADAYGLYTHIRSNAVRSMLLLAGLFFLVYLLLFAGALTAEALFADAPLDWLVKAAAADFIKAFPWATIGTAFWILAAYQFHQVLIDAVTGGRAVTRQEEPRLYNLLENLCISRGIPMPRLKIMQTEARNAFATGLNQKQYAITVTSGLVQALSDAELEAVLGHELTHIRNGDVRLLVVAVVIAGVISFFAELVFRGLFSPGRGGGFRARRSEGRRGGGGGGGVAVLIALVLIALAWILSIVVRLALSRSREFLADAGSVELTKNPDAMISALRKIEGKGELTQSPSAIMEMCVDNPREGFSDLFATHPSVQRRVDALVRFAGGHDRIPPREAESGAPSAMRENLGETQIAHRPPGPWGAAASMERAPDSGEGPWGPHGKGTDDGGSR
jgi:heat shock protein HtpX